MRPRDFIISDITDDDARPDREESELLFGEAIEWLDPESGERRARRAAAPPAEPEPEPDLEPEPEPEPELPDLTQEDEVVPAPVPVVIPAVDEPAEGRPRSETRQAAKRRRNLLIAAGAALVVLAIVAIAAFAGGGGDNGNDVASGDKSPGTTRATPSTTRVTTTTAPPTTSGQTITPQGTSVTVNADVLFDVGSADLTSAASSRLGAVLALARTDTSRKLLIEGYTDSDGDPTLNQQLSEQRAQSVAQWLIGQGIDPARITVVGHGADQPVSANDSPEHKALNRRVVVTLLTATQ